VTPEDRAEIKSMLFDHAQYIQTDMAAALQAFASTINDGLLAHQQLAHKQAAEVPLERAKMHHAMECYRLRLEHSLSSRDPFASSMTMQGLADAAKLDVEILFRTLKETP
jgi:hypothetical protein